MRGRIAGSFPARFPDEQTMTFNAWMRGVILILAAALAVTGLLMIAGVLDRGGIARELRIALGATVFLYGSYKFTVTWFRQPGRRER